MIKATPQTLKILNKDKIQQIIRQQDDITKPKISEISRISLVTTSKIVDELMEENKIVLSGTSESTGGRRALSYSINKDFRYYLGLYYYKETMIGAVANYKGEIFYENVFPFQYSLGNYLDQLFSIIDRLILETKGQSIAALGMGLPGVIREGSVSSIPMIPSWENINLKAILEDKYDFHTIIENDINITTLGEYKESYSNISGPLVLLYLEQGIGAGVVIENHSLLGYTSFAGEVGYIPVFDQELNGYLPFEDIMIRINRKLSEGKPVKEKLISVIAIVAISIITTVNPQILVIKHDVLDSTDLQKIEKKISKYVGKENVPTLTLGRKMRKKSIQGVIDLCFLEDNSVITVHEEKWR